MIDQNDRICWWVILHDTAGMISPYSRWQSTRNPFLQRVSNCPVVPGCTTPVIRSQSSTSSMASLPPVFGSFCFWHRSFLKGPRTKFFPATSWNDLGSFTIFQNSGHISLSDSIPWEHKVQLLWPLAPAPRFSSSRLQIVNGFSSGTVEVEMGSGQQPVVPVNISKCSHWIDIDSQFKQSYWYCLYLSPFCILLFERILKVLKVTSGHRTRQTGTVMFPWNCQARS